MFKHLLGEENVNNMDTDSRAWEESGVLKTFNQYEFLEDDMNVFEKSGLDKEGYVYYPNSCIGEGKSCKVHMFLHGCASGAENLYDYVVRNSGWI
jgi:hypothetical protein